MQFWGKECRKEEDNTSQCNRDRQDICQHEGLLRRDSLSHFEASCPFCYSFFYLLGLFLSFQNIKNRNWVVINTLNLSGFCQAIVKPITVDKL